ncbi:hypothetical protein KCP77_03830 [Salmonella enterica subsp. enterica]|nr:hypothetical protein KCP77_03830 [Salmonella enterica subsp. enterica]
MRSRLEASTTCLSTVSRRRRSGCSGRRSVVERKFVTRWSSENRCRYPLPA